MLILTTDLNYNMYSYFTFGLRYLKSLFQVKKLTSYQVLSIEASLKHEIFVAMRQMFAVRVLGNFSGGWDLCVHLISRLFSQFLSQEIKI